uniref:Intraflagellar transport 74 homolog n=1 Tax=Periophthalmus magnuspinnatus TaxID=409849 RepID=A0A3B4BE75_9GOBI
MATQRPPSGLARPVSRSGSGRPPTAVRPPPTAIRVGTGMVPGTGGLPGMRGGIPIAVPGVLSAQIKVTDRPVTQQGLSGMKTGMKGPQRQILDKSYYLGLLRSKINELTTETSKLHKEIDNFNQENSVYLSYEKTAEGLAAEIKDLQGQLADYNMVLLFANVSDISNHVESFSCIFYNYAFACAQELSQSQTKQEVVRLHQTFSSLEQKRDAMEAEQKNMGSPQEERDKLFKQVKDDNQEIASMERQLAEIRERTRQITEELRQMEQDSEDAQGFLESFEETRHQEENKQRQIQESIKSLLEQCSRVCTGSLSYKYSQYLHILLLFQLNFLATLPTGCVWSKSLRFPMLCVCLESRRLQQDLEKVQQLEGKISSELEVQRQQLVTMETELKTYRDIDSLKRNAEDKKKKLEEQRVSLSQRQESFRQLLDHITVTYEALKAKLEENETHSQLTNLEKKWQHIEQNNFVMKEFIASKSQESDYAPVAQRVSQQVAEYNKMLIDSLQNNRSLI